MKKFIDYEKANGDWKTAMGRYGALGFTDDIMGLNCPFESTLFYTGKIVWNVAFVGGSFLDDFKDPSYTSAPWAATRWIQGRVPLEQMFAPALKKCKECEK